MPFMTGQAIEAYMSLCDRPGCVEFACSRAQCVLCFILDGIFLGALGTVRVCHAMDIARDRAQTTETHVTELVVLFACCGSGACLVPSCQARCMPLCIDKREWHHSHDPALESLGLPGWLALQTSGSAFSAEFGVVCRPHCAIHRGTCSHLGSRSHSELVA